MTIPTLFTPVLGSLVLALLPGTGGPLRSEYRTDRSLRVTARSLVSMETTDFSMTVDGEPVEGRGGRMGGGGIEEESEVVLVDTVMAADDGRLVVRRTFEDLESVLALGGGEGSREMDRESSLDGVTLELVREDGEVAVSLHDGDEPDDEALAGHLPELALDALLPVDEVAEGDVWELETEQVRRALGLDQQLFGGGGGEEEGGGRGGRRFGGGGGFGPTGLLREAEWEGTAKLVAEDVEKDGVPCVAVELELDAEGEQEDRGFGGGRGRFAAGSSSPAAMLLETTYEIELRGRLWFSRAEGRPVALELSGSLSTERLTERERDGRVMVMEMSQEGTFEYSVHVEAIERAFPLEDE